jgi:hypothetical protein
MSYTHISQTGVDSINGRLAGLRRKQVGVMLKPDDGRSTETPIYRGAMKKCKSDKLS